MSRGSATGLTEILSARLLSHAPKKVRLKYASCPRTSDDILVRLGKTGQETSVDVLTAAWMNPSQPSPEYLVEHAYGRVTSGRASRREIDQLAIVLQRIWMDIRSEKGVPMSLTRALALSPIPEELSSGSSVMMPLLTQIGYWEDTLVSILDGPESVNALHALWQRGSDTVRYDATWRLVRLPGCPEEVYTWAFGLSERSLLNYIAHCEEAPEHIRVEASLRELSKEGRNAFL